MHLGRAVDDAHFGYVLPHVHQRRFIRHAERTVQVERAVNHVFQHAGHGSLHRRDLASDGSRVGLVAIEQPCRVKHVETELENLRVTVGDLLLHHLLVCQPLALGRTADYTLGHHFHRLVQHADGAHRMVDAATAETRLGNLEPSADGAERVFARHAAIGETNIAMHAGSIVVAWTDGGVAKDVHSRRARRDNNHGRSFMYGDVGIGDRHDDQEFGDAGVAGEPLFPVEHPFVAIQGGATGKLPRIRPGLGLGHRIARDDIAIEQRLEILRLLFVGPEAGEDFGIAGIGRLGTEHYRRKSTPPENFIHEAQFDLAKALATEFGTQMRCPQAALLDPLLQRPDQRAGSAVRIEGVRGAPENQVQRFNLGFHEVLHPVELLLELWLGRKIPAHVSRPRTSRRRSTTRHPRYTSLRRMRGTATRVRCPWARRRRPSESTP